MNTIRYWLARLAASLLDTFAAITGLYYSKKYAAIVKRLALRQQTTEDADDPGLIIIQIDGLAHEHLLQAMRRRRLPNIRGMLDRDGFTLSRWRCGLPSSTPAAQAGIMFGDNDDIPAFRWYDKPLRRSVVCKSPEIANQLQIHASRGKPGILSGGSSYVNMFDGGAARSLFTVSAFRTQSFFGGMRGAGLLALFLLNPLRTFRVLYLVLKEYATDSLQRLSARIKGQSYLPVLSTFPFVRIVSNVILREIETFAVLVDVYRGVPAIYANYYGYDEIAHHFGVGSRAALQSLHDIDQRIGQIERLQRAKLSRSYTLCLLSDHGLTPSQPFVERYGQTLGQYVSEQLGSSVFLVEHAGGEYDHMFQTRFLLDELKAVEQSLGPTATKVARRIRLLVQRRLRLNRELPEWDVERQHDVVVKSSGSLAHVYFNISNQRMDLSEISAAYPGLVVRLLAHEGIWLVIAREGELTLIMARDGVLTLGAEGQPYAEGTHPLLGLPDPGLSAEQIRRIASFAPSGDLILLGAYDPDENQVVCFERQWASHGGLGGPQDYPFIIYPQRLDWDLSHVRNSRDLYPFFARQRALVPEKKKRVGELT